MTPAPDSRPCPEPHVLAAFIEGKLDIGTRADLSRHLGTCPECLLVVSGASRFLASADESEEESEPATLWRRSLPVAASLALVCLIAAGWYVNRARDPLDQLRRVAGQLQARPVEGWLVGFPCRAYVVPQSGTVADTREEIAFMVAAERIRNRRGDNPRALHARAVATLLADPNDPATLRMLTQAVARGPRQATYRSDLAAAYIALATQTNDRTLLFDAVHEARCAAAIDPSLAPAYFNLAVALQHLGAREEALHAYIRALAVGPPELWDAEIHDRISRLH